MSRPDDQREMTERLHPAYPVSSDNVGALTAALRLPTFRAGGGPPLIRRLTLMVRDGAIDHVLDPVFPPNESAEQALDWLRIHPMS